MVRWFEALLGNENIAEAPANSWAEYKKKSFWILNIEQTFFDPDWGHMFQKTNITSESSLSISHELP